MKGFSYLLFSICNPCDKTFLSEPNYFDLMTFDLNLKKIAIADN